MASERSSRPDRAHRDGVPDPGRRPRRGLALGWYPSAPLVRKGSSNVQTPVSSIGCKRGRDENAATRARRWGRRANGEGRSRYTSRSCRARAFRSAPHPIASSITEPLVWSCPV
jgi:hypothetical protein